MLEEGDPACENQNFVPFEKENCVPGFVKSTNTVHLLHTTVCLAELQII